MTDSGSDAARTDAFVEGDDHETHMPMDSGGVPLYVAIIWVAFIIVYIIASALLILPDLRAWLAA